MTTTECTAGMTIEERWEYYIEVAGWTYIPDPTTWSGGVWWKDDEGSINQCGGTFPNIVRAVEAMDRHYRNEEMWR